ncbi:unnamed protein product [Symbiodinium natans]|uniref:Uncharacterized protein n=1 Tax=Symbiodinium natans TaxID=878477 RepID=A0A812SHS7_9DINO|nr:unnamed protein product [Symbiodinium natans]
MKKPESQPTFATRPLLRCKLLLVEVPHQAGDAHQPPEVLLVFHCHIPAEAPEDAQGSGTRLQKKCCPAPLGHGRKRDGDRGTARWRAELPQPLDWQSRHE